MAKCKICHRETEDGQIYCWYHLRAIEELKNGFESWSKAYEKLEWKTYLIRLLENESTGQWVKEVAGILLKEAG
jgi:hypothetical protein